jgi:hypothetical protein
VLNVSVLLYLPFLQFVVWDVPSGIIVVFVSIFAIQKIIIPEWIYLLEIHDADFTDVMQDHLLTSFQFGMLLFGIPLADIFIQMASAVSSFREWRESKNSSSI